MRFYREVFFALMFTHRQVGADSFSHAVIEVKFDWLTDFLPRGIFEKLLVPHRDIPESRLADT